MHCIASFPAKKQLKGYSNSPFLHSAAGLHVNYSRAGRSSRRNEPWPSLPPPNLARENLLVAGTVLADELVNVLDVQGLGLLGGVVLDSLPGAVELLLL